MSDELAPPPPADRYADAAVFASDFESLAAGQPFRSRGRTLTEADLVAFSGVTGDWHPQHSDAVWAGASRFGERVVHGMLVLSAAVALVDPSPDHVVALRGISKATFKAPVKIGDTIRAEGMVVATRAIDDETGLVETSWRVLNQRGAVTTLFSLEMVWRR